MIGGLTLAFVVLLSVTAALGAARGLLGLLFNLMSSTAPLSHSIDAPVWGPRLGAVSVRQRVLTNHDVGALVVREAA